MGDEPAKGLYYRQPPFSNYLIEAGKPDDLGLLLKCAPHAISKRNMTAYWDQFGEVFGMPIRIAKTSSRDGAEHLRIENMLKGMGAAPYALFPEGTEIELVESSRGDAYNVYDKRIERCNSELSKIILGETMTLDNGASLSQSKTHLDVFNRLVASDADMLRDVINDQVIPLCIMHGIFPAGCRFDWNESIDYTPGEQISIEQMVLSNYTVDPKYFTEKYNIPITGTKEATPAQPAGTQGNKSQKLAYDPNDFFA
jgi:phage gp29-like protein